MKYNIKVCQSGYYSGDLWVAKNKELVAQDEFLTKDINEAAEYTETEARRIVNIMKMVQYSGYFIYVNKAGKSGHKNTLSGVGAG